MSIRRSPVGFDLFRAGVRSKVAGCATGWGEAHGFPVGVAA